MRHPSLPLLIALIATGLGCEADAKDPAGFGPARQVGDRLIRAIDGPDQDRKRLDVTLTAVALDFDQPTDVQFLPNDPDLMVVLGKRGTAWWFDLRTGKRGELLKIDVTSRSEQGLLGLAFHPQFATNRRFFLNTTIRTDGRDVTRISEWVADGPDWRTASLMQGNVLLEVPQPYANHNAGQLAFGPDGYLYVGFGDGGAANDPKGHGQDTSSLLGAMLRIAVDGPKAPGKAYGIPGDNPFIASPGVAPEIWAYGLRNPWRYSFTKDGRLIVGDVGQNRYEEVAIVGRGENHGWNRREAAHCFPPGSPCSDAGLTDPIYEYGRSEGGSVTGGFVSGAGTTAGKYVFGDFNNGRMWAIDLPPPGPARPVSKAFALGRFGIAPSTFALDSKGRLYAADFVYGGVYRID